MKKPKLNEKRIQNRRARHDYSLDDSLLVGIQLTGAETKSLRLGQGQLRGAYVTLKNDELWLINSTIAGTAGVPISEEGQTRTRKLLAKRKEINKLIADKQQGKTIIPLEILTSRRFIKLRIAAGRGKVERDKRSSIQERQQKRDSERTIKQHSQRQ